VTITLRPMNAERLPAWLDETNRAYIEELIAAGRTREDATRHAAKSMEPAFPHGKPAPGHSVFDVVDDGGNAVGYLWIGPDTSDDPTSWWVWDIEINASSRGKGYGHATMVLGEEYARQEGARTLGLNVFGSNAAARALYEKLGYVTTQLQMRKPLAPEID